MFLIISILGLLTLATALTAACLWFKSSLVKTEESPAIIASISDVPEDYILKTEVNLDYVRQAWKEASRLNKLAAWWTGISAIFSAATTVAGIFR